MAAELSGAEQPWPSPLAAWYAVGVFTIATAFAFIDRQILVLLVEPVKKDLLVTDTQISLLTGFAFVMFYVLLGIPIARLADVHSRKLIVGTGVAIWSLMTAAVLTPPAIVWFWFGLKPYGLSVARARKR
jgi:MFS family permease